MGVAKKGRRKIVRNGRVFYWSVRWDDVYMDFSPNLSIVSEDKKFIVSYPLWRNQMNVPPEHIFIINIGKEFKGLDNLGHIWERFVVPDWENEIVTPSLIGKVIDWCFTVEDVVAVDCSGNILANRLDDRKKSAN